MKDIYKFWQLAENLKKETRWSSSPWGIIGKDRFDNVVLDNSASHSYGVMLMAMLISEHYKILHLDMTKVFKMIIMHDLPEAIAGDLDAYEAILNPELKSAKHKKEFMALETMTSNLPIELKNVFTNLWNEYEEQATSEAKFVKLCDRLETISQMAKADISTREPDDVKEGAKYGKEILAQHPEYKEIITIFKEKQKENFIKQGFVWQKEYDVLF